MKFFKQTVLTLVLNVAGEIIDDFEQIFVVGVEYSGDIINCENNVSTIQFDDGSVAYGVSNDIFTV